jgi:polysaccharide export outer membrane protein
LIVAGCVACSLSAGRVTFAQQNLPNGIASTAAPAGGVAPTAAAAGATGITPPSDYVIGPNDQLLILFWREKDLSADVLVRPDGKISLPLLNDVQAGGLTPEQLRVKVTEAAQRFVEDPNATVVVRQINSRKVFITGEVEKPGEYVLAGPTTVLQLIATAGGLKEYADREKIVVLRTENGREEALKFNYQQVVRQQNPKQNITLKPGDTVIVP